MLTLTPLVSSNLLTRLLTPHYKTNSKRITRPGKILELNFAIYAQEKLEYPIIPYNPWPTVNRDLHKDEKSFLKSWAFTHLSDIDRQNNTFMVMNYPYTRPFKRKQGRTEFTIVSEDVPLMRIECKHQDVNGSVDEKLGYLAYVLDKGYFPESELLIVVNGNYYTDEYVSNINEDLSRDIKDKTIQAIKFVDLKTENIGGKIIPKMGGW